jgi:hypothetical protein
MTKIARFLPFDNEETSAGFGQINKINRIEGRLFGQEEHEGHE